ncbi:hypothetical protein [Parafilimonas sp.]|uniref:hypothetical protein n=1 Tax=Parafilimonas sp. TaxID=1969739 RepID=UPI0039E22A44
MVFLDYYLSVPPEYFTNNLPFALGDVPEDGIDDVVPGKMYSRKELKDYAMPK